ncbi:unnamed protein product [Malus baccata var. baccata]
MSGYSHSPPGYGYGYGHSYGSASPPGQPYGAPPQGQHQYDHKARAYGAPAKPHKNQAHGGGYPAPARSCGSLFAALVPSVFPPGTDPEIIACFQLADQDGSGFIDDKEMQRALSSYNQSFSLRTVHLLMYLFTQTNTRKIVFERFDRDRSGFIDANELRDALLSLGFAVSPVVLELLVYKFGKTGGKKRAIEYDNFIEYVSFSFFLSFFSGIGLLIGFGLTEKFKEKDKAYTGMGTFTYEEFMLTVLPFLIA